MGSLSIFTIPQASETVTINFIFLVCVLINFEITHQWITSVSFHHLKGLSSQSGLALITTILMILRIWIRNQSKSGILENSPWACDVQSQTNTLTLRWSACYYWWDWFGFLFIITLQMWAFSQCFLSLKSYILSKPHVACYWINGSLQEAVHPHTLHPQPPPANWDILSRLIRTT